MKSKILLLAAFGLAAMPAIAQDIPTAVVRCAAIKDESARLACYDGIAAGLKQAAVTQTVAPPTVAAPAAAVPPPPVVAASPSVVSAPPAAPPPPVAAKVAEFGAEAMRKPEPDSAAPQDVDEIKAKVTEVVFSPHDRFTVTLDNGQVWRQIDADAVKARFHKAGDAVTIARGAIGSYNLTVDGHDFVIYKVHRMR